MSKYQIVRWDAVTDCNGMLRPMLYFKPDMDMVLFSRENNYKIHIDIKDAQYYSGEQIPGTVDIASQQPNFRPNFFEACHLYVITLSQTHWLGFPDIGTEGTFAINKKVISPQCWKTYGPPGDEIKRNSIEVASILETPQNVFIDEKILKQKKQQAQLADAKMQKTVNAINTNNAESKNKKPGKESMTKVIDAMKTVLSNKFTAENTMNPRFEADTNLQATQNNYLQKLYREPYRSSGPRGSRRGVIWGMAILLIILVIFIIILGVSSNNE